MSFLKHDFSKEDPWRIFRIMSEFVEGIEGLKDVRKAVSIFGSSRAKPKDSHYKLAEETSYALAKAGYAVITGAGKGIMEAGNKGAHRAGGLSIGLNILIPLIQKPNKYITRLIEFDYFFCRKVMFAKYSKAFCVFPGGFGTMDEFFEAVSLIQTQRVEPFPVILIGSGYWKGLIKWVREVPVKKGAIYDSELAIFKTIDRPREVVKFINAFYRK
jgi:uncharacterized protein (TIGR00730 family)